MPASWPEPAGGSFGGRFSDDKPWPSTRVRGCWAAKGSRSAFDRGPEDYNRVEMFDPDSYPPQDNEAARRSQEVKGNPYPTFNEWAKANADV